MKRRHSDEYYEKFRIHQARLFENFAGKLA